MKNDEHSYAKRPVKIHERIGRKRLDEGVSQGAIITRQLHHPIHHLVHDIQLETKFSEKRNDLDVKTRTDSYIFSVYVNS